MSKSAWDRMRIELGQAVDADRLLIGASTYVLPALIGIFSIVALIAWKPYFPAEKSTPLELQVFEDTGDVLTPAVAVERLELKPKVNRAGTARSEHPFWFQATAPALEAGETTVVEFPSRHANEIICWDAVLLDRLGAGSRLATEGAISQIRSGFALTLQSSQNSSQILCRSTFSGPATITASQWLASSLNNASKEFHRNSGLLDGGILVLGLVTIVTGLILREKVYLLFAAWLILNLRVAALSVGWDVQWLGRMVPAEWLVQIRMLTVAGYCVIGTVMFRVLFKEELIKEGYQQLLKSLQWCCFPLVPLALVLSFQQFLPFLWAASGITVAVLAFALTRIVIHRPSRVALLYGASYAITLIASLSEVISAALEIKGIIGAINHVTAALSSSVLATLAIAEWMRSEHVKRVEVQAELEHTYEAMPIGLFTLDLDGTFTSANPALLTMLDANVLARGHDKFEQYFSAGATAALFDMVHSPPSTPAAELELVNGSTADAKRFLVKATLARGKIEGSLQDITEKSKAVEELRFLANNDSLTKVLNRRGAQQVLHNAILNLRPGRHLSLAYLDLDRFKLINGLYGHSAGDQVLKQVCDRVASMLAKNQHIGRLGGDEFLLILEDTSIHAADWLCKGIINRVGADPYRLGDKAFQLRCSIGLVEVSPGMHIKDAIATADQACREAKVRSTTGLITYDKTASVFANQEAEFHLVEHLSGDKATEGLYLEMQPIMSLKDPEASLNFEVLIRMKDTNGAFVPAGRILSAAENSGRTAVIDRWVMSTTLAWLSSNMNNLPNTKFVCMNLSGASLNDERFMQEVFQMLERNPRAAGVLCIEITESVALYDLGNTRKFIDRVRSYGVKVALDDFGAGYTSFTYLKDLPADILKIDGSFIVNMNKHPANVAIVEAIVSLGKSLGMRTIAEWAEDIDTMETLSEIGVEYVQGYAIARPMAPEILLTAHSAGSFMRPEDLKLLSQSVKLSAGR
jgi:diguanylate cyclase (GGDEF)-like protein